MARLRVISAAILAIAVSTPVICTTTTSPASAQEWRDRDGEMDRDLRDLLRDRVRTRQDLRDLITDLFHDRPELRSSREGVSHWRDEEEEDGRGGWRGPPRERTAERLAERRRSGEEEDCYFLTRSLQDQDGDFVVLVRRRVCRD